MNRSARDWNVLKGSNQPVGRVRPAPTGSAPRRPARTRSRAKPRRARFGPRAPPLVPKRIGGLRHARVIGARRPPGPEFVARRSFRDCGLHGVDRSGPGRPCVLPFLESYHRPYSQNRFSGPLRYTIEQWRHPSGTTTWTRRPAAFGPPGGCATLAAARPKWDASSAIGSSATTTSHP